MLTNLLLSIKTMAGALSIPTPILIVGVALIALAVVGAVVAVLVSKMRGKGKNEVSDFERMVQDKVGAQGVVDKAKKKVAESSPISASNLEEEVEEESNPSQEDERSDEVEKAPVRQEEEVEIAAAHNLVEQEEDVKEEEPTPLFKKRSESLENEPETSREVPDLVEEAVAIGGVDNEIKDSSEEEDEIVLVAVDTAKESDSNATLLNSMTDSDKDYGDFDFGGDFDEWEDEPEEPEDAEEDILAELDSDEEDVEMQTQEENVTGAENGIVGSKYRRSFRSKLIQGGKENKQYYSVIKNELLSYDKARCNESWGGESFIWGRKTLVRMSLAGKTLCVFLALEPRSYADVSNKLRFRDVSNVRKYAATPMLMRVKSDLSLRRTLRLITHIALTNDLHKKAAYTSVDYVNGLAYKDDETLLNLNMIKLNPKYVQQVDTAAALEAKEAESRTRPIFDVTPVKKEQVGNLTEKDLEKLEKKKERTEAANRQFASENGKFVIEAVGNSWRFMFYAASGRLLCVGESCNSKELAYKSVTAFRTVIDSGDALVSTIDGKYFYSVRSYGRVFKSVMYDSQSACLDGLRTARDTAQEAVVEFSV